MQVLLWQNLEKIGKRGEVVNVTDGYARNYLFPRKLASTPTPNMYKALEYEKVQVAKKQTKVLTNLKALAEQIEKVSITMEVNTNEEGHLYGSITPAMIVDGLKKQDIDIDAKHIEIDQPIKEVGVYQIKINLHKSVQPTVKVWIVSGKSE